LNFYLSIAAKEAVPPLKAALPCFVLRHRTWDDFGFKTLFELTYCKSNGAKVMIGELKILMADEKETKLPPLFETLDGYFSLGQDISYYRRIRENFPKTHRKILEALNDVVALPQLLEEIELSSGYRNSMARFTDAEISLRDGAAVLDGVPTADEGFAFSYEGSIIGADEPVSIKVNLDPDDPVPGRVFAIIGRNGVGKTQFLARLALDLATQGRRSKETVDKQEAAFQPSRPLFSRVIALSFSAFDKFQKPKPGKYFSYIYCGVRDDGGGLSRTALEARHLQYMKRVQEQNREWQWENLVKVVLGLTDEEVSFTRALEALERGEASSMSSGQSILIYFISAALAYLKPRSLILFDEPEIHLHPNAVGQLIQIMQWLLKHFDSYAILATHSPVVIQEIPRKRVVKFEREGNFTSATPLDQESFGENISELTRQVFETVEVSNFYKQTLKKLAKSMSFDDVSKLFDDQLNMHAAAYLGSLYEEVDA
jgi:predicted ATPase